ncbi:MAG TPA: thioesterase family protein [Longimicrobium sp.]|nr:thioesterase family protein [Longimicrobium sp.]
MTDERTAELLAGYPVVVEIPVAWGDMDYFRHVNNIVFFRYFESARIEYLERIGFRELADDDPVGPILASTGCRFRRPLTWPDTVAVGARVVEVGEDRFSMAYRLVSRKSGEVAAEGDGLLVAFDYAAQKKVPLPERVWRAIELLEGR